MKHIAYWIQINMPFICISCSHVKQQCQVVYTFLNTCISLTLLCAHYNHTHVLELFNFGFLFNFFFVGLRIKATQKS